MYSSEQSFAMDSREVRRLIEHYFHRGFQNQVIVDFLNNRHGVTMSLSTLKRRLRDYGLSRRGVDVSDHEVRDIVQRVFHISLCTMSLSMPCRFN